MTFRHLPLHIITSFILWIRQRKDKNYNFTYSDCRFNINTAQKDGGRKERGLTREGRIITDKAFPGLEKRGSREKGVRSMKRTSPAKYVLQAKRRTESKNVDFSWLEI